MDTRRRFILAVAVCGCTLVGCVSRQDGMPAVRENVALQDSVQPEPGNPAGGDIRVGKTAGSPKGEVAPDLPKSAPGLGAGSEVGVKPAVYRSSTKCDTRLALNGCRVASKLVIRGDNANGAQIELSASVTNWAILDDAQGFVRVRLLRQGQEVYQLTVKTAKAPAVGLAGKTTRGGYVKRQLEGPVPEYDSVVFEARNYLCARSYFRDNEIRVGVTIPIG